MIARDVDQARAGATLREQRAHDLRVLVVPEDPLREIQVIDDVARQHDGFGVDAAQEGSELARPRALESEVNVRKEQRSRRESSLAHRGMSLPRMSLTACWKRAIGVLPWA